MEPEVIEQYFLIGVMGVLSLTLLVCLFRAVIGPRFSDRIVAINMINTQVILFIAVLAVYLKEEDLVDISILYAIVGFLAVVIFTRIDIGLQRDRLEQAEIAEGADTDEKMQETRQFEEISKEDKETYEASFAEQKKKMEEKRDQ